jgi:antibiotic biosynthesis monooxygenase (ABM) superfamily enzyme
MTNETVTSIVHHHIKPDHMDDFNLWLKNIQIESQKFDGYIDTQLIDNCGNINERISIFRFRNQSLLDKWLNSEIHQRKLLDLSKLTTQKTTIKSYKSLEYWFDRTPESVFKMSLLTYIGLLPLVLIVPPLLIKLIPMGDTMLASVSTAIIVLLMSYIVMPFVMKIYSKVTSK